MSSGSTGTFVVRLEHEAAQAAHAVEGEALLCDHNRAL